jgi:hypothetical protein
MSIAMRKPMNRSWRRQGATIFSRQGDDWVAHAAANAAVLSLPEIGIELPLAVLFEGLTLDEPDTAASTSIA